MNSYFLENYLTLILVFSQFPKTTKKKTDTSVDTEGILPCKTLDLMIFTVYLCLFEIEFDLALGTKYGLIDKEIGQVLDSVIFWNFTRC